MWNNFSKSKLSTCSLGPFSFPLLKAHSQSVSQLITTIINLSLQIGFLPVSLKTATIKFLPKNPTLDPLPLSNYRPIPNLPFIYKKLERIVSTQLYNHLLGNAKSHPHTVTCGVTQDSVLGPTLFTTYMLPPGRVVGRHRV